MKAILVASATLWLTIFFLRSASIPKEGISEEYVYLLKVEGGRVYRIAEKTTGDKKESVKKEIRRMELIYPETILEIEKGASVFLTWGGCKVLNLTYKDSPFVVKMEGFEKEKSATSKIMEYFTMALNNFVHPDSKPGSKIRLSIRGHRKTGVCNDLWPADGARILPLGPVTFKWEGEGPHFSLEIKEFGSNAAIYSEKTMLKRIDLPVEIFGPGRRYEWSLLEEETGEKCSATFALLSKDESSRIMEIVNNLALLLPPGIDLETRCRLQAGYLVSDGFYYDAWRWLDRNGISQQY